MGQVVPGVCETVRREKADLDVAYEEIDLANPKTITCSAGFIKEEREWFGLLLKETGVVDSFRELYGDDKGAETVSSSPPNSSTPSWTPRCERKSSAATTAPSPSSSISNKHFPPLCFPTTTTTTCSITITPSPSLLELRITTKRKYYVPLLPSPLLSSSSSSRPCEETFFCCCFRFPNVRVPRTEALT